MSEKIITFTANVIRQVYSNQEDYWIWAVEPLTNIETLERNTYGNISICGNTGELSLMAKYEISAIASSSKYGISYQVQSLKREEPLSEFETKIFLSEIITENQANEIYKHYPDIISRVKNNNLDDIDISKLKRINQKTFDRIIHKIADNFCLADIVARFNGYFSFSIIKKLYEKYLSTEAVITAIEHNPYKCLCDLSGISFKKADSLLLEMNDVANKQIVKGENPVVCFEEDLKTSKSRCLSCLIYILQENENNGHTKMNLATLHKHCLTLVPEAINHFNEAIKSSQIYYNKSEMEVSTIYSRKAEEYIANRIIKALKNNTNNKWNCEIAKYKKIDNNELSEEQLLIIQNICNYNINILNGSAGTGKSFSTKAIINMLDDYGKSYVLMSPTGKASKVLADYTSKNATTIHRGLGYMPPNSWTYNEDNKLMVDVVIVDEFSMVDIFLFKKILEAIDFNYTKLLLIGDNAQLPSVQCGNLLQDFMTSNIIPTVTLSRVFRYSEGGLMKIATDVRQSKKYLNTSHKQKATYFGNNKDYMFIDTPNETMPKKVIALYQKLMQQGYNPEDIQVLISKNVGMYGTIKFNKYLQKIANPNVNNYEGMTYGEGDTSITFYPGDIVIQIQNNYKAKITDENGNYKINDYSNEIETAFVANGETGKIIHIFKTYIVVNFDGVYIAYKKGELGQIKLGYSISIHKSQGSSIKIPILLTPSSDVYMLNSNLIYVGLTRMKDKCYHFGTVQSVNLAVSKKANLDRDTFMVNLLKQYFNEIS